MTTAATLIIAALRDKPEGWDDIVLENLPCTLPGEWDLLAILAKGYGLTGSTGGNGAADDGKAALFDASGGLRAETLTADDYILAGSVSNAGTFTIVSANGIGHIKAGNLNGEYDFQLADGQGILSIKVAAPASTASPGVGGMWAEDGDFLYVYSTGAGAWRRVSIGPW